MGLLNVMTEEEYGAYLEHHGILGMKWGIRRYQPYPEGQHGTFLGQSRDQDIRIKKGSTAFRVQSSKELNPEQKAIYASFKNTDHFSYLKASVYGDGVATDCTWESKSENEGRPYSLKIKVQKDLIAPSYNTTMEIFIDTVNKAYQENPLSKKEFKQLSERGKDFVKNWNDTKHQEALDKAYEIFSATLMQDTKLRSMFFDNLEKKGYNAIVDENDKHFGKSNWTEAPMIVFDQSSLKVSGAKALSNDDVRFFQDYEANENMLKNNPDSKFAQAYLNYKPRKDWDKWINHAFSECGAYLEHHGIKGQKWGVRRYQDYAKGEKSKGVFIGDKKTPSKRQQRKAEKLKKKKFAEVQKARAKAEAEKKAAKEQEKKNEKIREKLLVSRDPEYIAKHMHLLSNKELNERISRLKSEDEMKKLASKKKKTGEQYIDSILKWGNKANDVYKMLNSDLGKAIQKKMRGEQGGKKKR